jgi:hypothetical protein
MKNALRASRLRDALAFKVVAMPNLDRLGARSMRDVT